MTDRPWMTALEMQFAAHHCAGLYENDLRSRWVYDARQHLRVAECYAFSAETTVAIAAAARTVPGSSCMTPEMFPAPCGWWWFESPISVPGLHSTTDQCVALSWSTIQRHFDEKTGKVDKCIGLWSWAMSFKGAAGLFPGFHERLIGTDTLDDLAQAHEAMAAKDETHRQLRLASLAVWRFLFAGTAWLQQRIVSVSSGRVERHRRKQIAREHNVPAPSEVKVVELRRYETEPHVANPNPEHVDWSCRWIVNGHWRKQPTKDGIRVIPIGPYVKGPADKPLKVPKHTVYMVDR